MLHDDQVEEPILPPAYIYFARIPTHKSVTTLIGASLLISLVVTLPEYMFGLVEKSTALLHTLSLAGLVIFFLISSILLRYIIHYLFKMRFFSFYLTLNSYGQTAVIMVLAAVSMLEAAPLSGTVGLFAAAMVGGGVFLLISSILLLLLVGTGMGFAAGNPLKGVGVEMIGLGLVAAIFAVGL
jgi:hypothetical protein